MEGNMNTSPDLTKVKIDGDHIEIELDKVVVTGKILERNSGEITVTIISPYQGITLQSGNVPIPLRQYRNYLGPAGDAKAAELLSDIYGFCLYVEEHQAELLAALAEYEEAVYCAKHLDPVKAAKKQRMGIIAGEIKEIKQSLRSGIIDSLAYQRQIGRLKKEMEDLTFDAEMDTWEAYLRIFQPYDDTPVGRLRPENVIPYLNSIR